MTASVQFVILPERVITNVREATTGLLGSRPTIMLVADEDMSDDLAPSLWQPGSHAFHRAYIHRGAPVEGERDRPRRIGEGQRPRAARERGSDELYEFTRSIVDRKRGLRSCARYGIQIESRSK